MSTGSDGDPPIRTAADVQWTRRFWTPALHHDYAQWPVRAAGGDPHRWRILPPETDSAAVVAVRMTPTGGVRPSPWQHTRRGGVTPMPDPAASPVGIVLQAAMRPPTGRKRARQATTDGATTARDDAEEEDPCELSHAKTEQRHAKVPLRAYRVQVRLTRRQRAEIRRWFACADWAYNAFVRAVNQDGKPWTSSPTIITSSVGPVDLRSGVPRSVWWNAAREAQRAFRSNWAKQAAQRARGERVMRTYHVRERRPRASAVLEFDGAQLASATKKSADLKVVHPIVAAGPSHQGRRRHADARLGCGMRGLGMIRLIDSARVIDRLVADGCLRHAGLLQWNRHRRNAFHLIVRLEAEVPPPRVLMDGAPPRLVSLDPGARHFQVWYDPRDGSHGELLAGWDGAAAHTAGATTPPGTAQRRTRRRRRLRETPGDADLDWWLSHYRRQNRRRRRRPPPPRANGGALAELDRRLERRQQLANRRRRCARGDEHAPGRVARRERQRLADAGVSDDPPHRRWLRNQYRRRVRERRAAYWRESDRLDGWRTTGHYDAIRFLPGHRIALTGRCGARYRRIVGT